MAVGCGGVLHVSARLPFVSVYSGTLAEQRSPACRSQAGGREGTQFAPQHEEPEDGPRLGTVAC